jgi:hypothetical protein
VAALGSDQPGDISGQHDLEHLQARPDRQGEQALAGGAGQFDNRNGHLLRQLELGKVGRGGAVGILRHGGPLLVWLLGGCPTPTTRQASGGDRHLNFYGNRDNLLRQVPARAWQQISCGTGAKGHRLYDWAFLCLDHDHWLMVRRNQRTGELAFYRCYTPHPVPLASPECAGRWRWSFRKWQKGGCGPSGEVGST